MLCLAGCGSSAKLMSGLSIEELKPVPGILSSAKLLKGTIHSITGDRVEVETGERTPRYLSLEAGGDEARGLQVGGAVEIMVNDHDEIVAYQRPADTPPTKVFRGSLGKVFNPQKERVTIRLDTGRDVGFYARAVAMDKLAALEVGETADFAVDRAYLLVDVLSLEAGGDEARGLQVGGAVEIMVNDHDEIVAYQRPADTPPTKVFRGSLGKVFNPQKERVTIRLDTGRDVGFYARAVAMDKLAALEVGETADFAVDRAYLLVDVLSLGKPRDLGVGSALPAPQRRVEGAFVTIGDGRMRLRMKVDDIQSFSVRPLLQPAIEQLDPNETVFIFLDGQGQVIDMVRTARR